jgi:hypothetical protein
MKIKDLVVQLYNELQSQVEQLSISVASHDGKDVIALSFLPKGNLPLTLNIPDDIPVIIEKMKQRVLPFQS